MTQENFLSTREDAARLTAQAAVRPLRRRHVAVLAVCAIVTFAAYAALLRLAPGLVETVPSHIEEVVPWLPGMAPQPNGADDHGAAALLATPLAYGALLVVLFTAYGVALGTVARRSSRALEAAVFGAGTMLLAFHALAPVQFSNDIYAYAAGGRVFDYHHENPAVDTSVLPPDDVYIHLYGRELGSMPYGPLWTLIEAGVAWLGGERVGLTVLCFRIVAVLGVAIAALLLWSCLRRIDPPRAAQGLVFFLWNPLVVIEAGLGGHNDAVMVALCVAGITLHLRQRPALAMACFTLSALIKCPTAVLLPLYVLMMLRGSPSWRQRGRFLAFATAGVTVALAAVLGPLQLGLRGGPPRPAARGWTLPNLSFVFGQDYTNSIHELLFRAMRLRMGEDPADCRVVDFCGWWVVPREATPFHTRAEETSPLLARLAADTRLLVIAPREESWLRVLDPATGRKGYVLEKAVEVCDPPAAAEADPALRRWTEGRSPTAFEADRRLRICMWAAFGSMCLWAAWYASNLQRFLVASAGLLLASYWLVSSWFFAWYVMWAVALAAFVPHRPVALLAALLSATALTLYATVGLEGAREIEWVYVYRSLFVFVPPPLGVLAVCLWPFTRRKAGPPPPPL